MSLLIVIQLRTINLGCNSLIKSIKPTPSITLEGCSSFTTNFVNALRHITFLNVATNKLPSLSIPRLKLSTLRFLLATLLGYFLHFFKWIHKLLVSTLVLWQAYYAPQQLHVHLGSFWFPPFILEKWSHTSEIIIDFLLVVSGSSSYFSFLVDLTSIGSLVITIGSSRIEVTGGIF